MSVVESQAHLPGVPVRRSYRPFTWALRGVGVTGTAVVLTWTTVSHALLSDGMLYTLIASSVIGTALWALSFMQFKVSWQRKAPPSDQLLNLLEQLIDYQDEEISPYGTAVRVRADMSAMLALAGFWLNILPYLTYLALL